MPPWCGYEEYRALGSQWQMDSVAVFKPFYTKKHTQKLMSGWEDQNKCNYSDYSWDSVNLTLFLLILLVLIVL